jgi:hypothetical protein
MTTTSTRKTMDVEAADLRPGDFVLDEHGAVEHGVFDAHHPGGSTHVRIWTREVDQRLGWPYAYKVSPTTRYRISRFTR